MTLNNDIILKSWLKTLRYSIEYYEDTFDSKNKPRENSRSAENMIVGGETNEDSNDEQYVNVWECSDSDKSASKFKNSLESIENNSEVLYFEGDTSSSSFNTQSVTDLSVGSYLLEDTQSLGLSYTDEVTKITDLDEEAIDEKPQKPKVTPRISKDPSRNQVVYENLPLRTQNSIESFKDNHREKVTLNNSEEESDNAPIYENLPLRPQSSEINTEKGDNFFKNFPIYENLPLYPRNSIQLIEGSNFEDEVCSTIQYLEDVLDSVDISDEDSDIEDDDTFSNENHTSTLESNNSRSKLKFGEKDFCTSQILDEEKFTESSSSFEEYVSNEHLITSNRALQSLNQRFAKDSRISAFFEEAEPVLPQEIKYIPIPKIGSTTFYSQNRYSMPTNLRKVKDDLNVKRPQSLQTKDYNTADIEEFESFELYINRNALNSSKVICDIDGLQPQNDGSHIAEEAELRIDQCPLNTRFPVNLEDKTKDLNEEVATCETVEDHKRKKNAQTQSLNISYANESRVSTLFEEGEVQELNIFEVAPETAVFEKDCFFNGLRGNVLIWMADLMREYCGEELDIMEEKELLKSINQVPKDRIDQPSENKFPVYEENVEIRKKPSIRRNRISKTTDFDLGRSRHEIPINPKDFDVRGIVKFQLPNNKIIPRFKQEYVAYKNEVFYRINEKTKLEERLTQKVPIKLARYMNSKSKESKEVELKDAQNQTYILYFESTKYAKQFMENEKIQVYVPDNKTTIKDALLRFLGKRSSREILEKKGIYKNEPIFGNTLRDIYIKGAANSGSPVPKFIYRVIELIEKQDNIQSLGLYRTSGNLATIQKIRFEVDNGRLGILDQFSKDPDVLTGSLKLFFRELKEPLIPCEVSEKMMEIIKSDLKQISHKEHQKIKSILVENLQEANLETFVVVMRHLLTVVKYKEHNKMDAYNLAVCWGPSMIFSVHAANPSPTCELSKDIVMQSQNATRLVDFLLGYYEMYLAELNALSKRPESITEKILVFTRQESTDSIKSFDSSKSQKKSSSSLSLSIDEAIKKLIEMIEPHLSTEGLYIKSGSSDKTNKIMKKLNKKKISELDKYKADVYDVAEAFKKYLREQDCLVTEEIVELVLKATSDNSQNYLEPITRRKVTSLVEEAPKKDTLLFLLRHLAKVIEHQTRHTVSKEDIINVWTEVLNYQKKCRVPNEEFAKFLTVAVEVFNDNLPDVVRSSFNNNGSSPNRNEIMGEVVKQIKHQQERDRNSRYDNVDCSVAEEATILDDKTEETKL